MSNIIFNQLCLEDDKSGKGSEQLQIVNFSDRSLGWVLTKQVFSFCYDNNMHLAQFAWFCKPANNRCGHLTVVLPDKWTIWSTILNLIQEGMKNGTVEVLWCQASRLMLVFLDEHLNRAYKINQEKDLLCQNFSWADKGLAQSENCLLACSFIGKSSQRYSKANQT